MEPDLAAQMETFAHSRTPQLSWALGSEDLWVEPREQWLEALSNSHWQLQESEAMVLTPHFTLYFRTVLPRYPYWKEK